MKIYTDILTAKNNNNKLLAILIDPEKIALDLVQKISEKINDSPATHIFIGGSTFKGKHLTQLISLFKKYSALPVLLFPGDYTQISNNADALLFLTLLSGRNPEYLIEHQIKAVPLLEKTTLEVISTAYLLIDGGTVTAVEKVSKTTPLARTNIDVAYQTAKAGEYLGCKLIYLETGSGAKQTVPLKMIETIAQKTTVPIIVGGGIRSKETIDKIYKSGATLVVIGTAFENNSNFFN